eukprot:g17553.t1
MSAVPPLLAPPEGFEGAVAAGTAKANLTPEKIFCSSILGGAFIGYGAYLACTESNPGVQKMIFGAFGLPFGLFMTLLSGSELFTGNAAIVSMALLQGKVQAPHLAKSIGAFCGQHVHHPSGHLRRSSGELEHVFSEEPAAGDLGQCSGGDVLCRLPFRGALRAQEVKDETQHDTVYGRSRCSDAADLEKGRRLREAKDQLSREDFCIGLRKCGWTWGVGDLNWVFDALQDQQQGILKVENLRWMGIELARKQKKQEAKARSKKWQDGSARNAPAERRGLVSAVKHRHFATFKAFLRKKFGNLIRAWRQALSQTDSMVLSKLHFLKAASRLGFAKESKELWKALDKDDSGSASIDELDPKNAELLAHFKVWVSQKFGGFANGLKKFEFERPTKQLFSHFDKDGDGKIIIDDVMFLENWTPLPFLVVAPNYKAKEEIRRLILVRTGQYMKAWRRLLDKDATNRASEMKQQSHALGCNWYEFKEAYQVLGYTGDIPGAWRAFDDDLSGYISLKEIDESSAMILSNFRKWAIMEFGSMRSLFSVFDEDCSGSLSWQEFRYACNAYSYDGSIRSLFNALDVDQTGSLTLKEVVFLEDWDDPDEEQ